jgi:hypothetical protein
MDVSFYSRFVGSQLGSSTLFGGAFFAEIFPSDGFVEAAAVGGAAAASWFAAMPLLKRAIQGIHGA